MIFINALFGRALASKAAIKQKITVIKGIPLLGLGTLASTGYGPEAALSILLPLGAMGLYYFPIIMIGVVVMLRILYLSYHQTIGAYPNGAWCLYCCGEKSWGECRLICRSRITLGLSPERCSWNFSGSRGRHFNFASTAKLYIDNLSLHSGYFDHS